jgi:hypothetical protein
MSLSHHPSIVKNGLVAYFDAANPKSYPAGQDPFVNNVSLMLDGESLIDKSANARTFTASAGASISTANKKYGNSSIYCNGSNSYIYNSSFNSSFSGDFTIEFWVYFNALSSINNLIFIGNESSGRHGIFINSIGKPAIDLYFTGTIVTFNSTITTGSWVHLAFVRTGTTVKLFVNGVQDSTTGTISGTYGNANGVYIGSDSNAIYSTNAYFDDIRITSGISRYTASFTPPTAPLSLPGVVTDLTKNRVVGTLTNAPTYNSGNGGSIVFTRASNNYVSVGALSGSFASFSVIVWFYATNIANYENVLDCNYAYNGTTGNIGPRLEMNAAGNLGWVYSNITNNNDSHYSHPVIDSGMTANSWRCVGISYNSNGNSSVTYLNGLNTGKSRVTNGSATGFIATMNNLRIGQGFNLDSYTQRGFDGRVSMVQIYNRTLTAAEVLQNYNATKGRFGY